MPGITAIRQMKSNIVDFRASLQFHRAELGIFYTEVPQFLEKIEVLLRRRPGARLIERIVVAAARLEQYAVAVPDYRGLSLPVRMFRQLPDAYRAGYALRQLQQAVTAAGQSARIADQYAHLGLAAAASERAHCLDKFGIIECFVIQARAEYADIACGCCITLQPARQTDVGIPLRL